MTASTFDALAEGMREAAGADRADLATKADLADFATKPESLSASFRSR